MTKAPWIGDSGVASDTRFESAQRRLDEARLALEALDGGGLDAVVLPRAEPLLLGEAEQAITRSEARLRHLIDRMAGVVVELSPNGDIVYLNQACAIATGFSAEELAERNWFELLRPLPGQDSPETLRAHFAAGGEVTAYRAGLVNQRGDDRILEWSSANVRSADGVVTRVLCLGMDVSARVQAEQELRIAATAFESQQGMMVTDANSIILRVNCAFTRLTGYTPEEAIGFTPALLKSDRHSDVFYRRLWHRLQRERYWQGEIWNRRKDGRVYAEWLTISAVIDGNGEVSHYVGAFSDITRNKVAEAEIHRLAFYDPLTELPNRRLLHDRLNQALVAATRTRRGGAVLFIDLDNFKLLNDTRGHEVGDRLLVEVALRLRTCVRGSDTVARLGGDEFVVLLEDLDADHHDAANAALAVGEKLLAELNKPYGLAGHEYFSTCSIGISLFQGDADSVEELLKRADAAMYRAKDAGRDAIRFFDPAMQEALEERSALEAELRNALARNEFRLHYQPQVDRDGRLLGAEVLLRWYHPVRGLISPLDFIPLAEDTGLILPIGQWVLEVACERLKAWAGGVSTNALRLAVNVSARQFRHPDFIGSVRRVLQQTGADPHRLKLELTETMVLGDIDEAIATMRALGALGVGFSMDDFGTGYSSLSSLKRLPLEQVKIDSSFVRDLPADADSGVIVQTIITMARTLGLDVIAEGVETEAQRAFLAHHGCPLFQGYLFGRPLPLEEFERLVSAG